MIMHNYCIILSSKKAEQCWSRNYAHSKYKRAVNQLANKVALVARVVSRLPLNVIIIIALVILYQGCIDPPKVGREHATPIHPL